MNQFDKGAVKRWRREIYRAFEREGFKPPEIMASMVYAAVTSFGTDTGVLAEITGLSVEYCTKVLRRLRKQGVVSGQTIRSCSQGDEIGQHVGACLDAGIAAGMFVHAPDPKRSAGQKARAATTRARGPRRKRTAITPGAIFTPARKASNRLIGLPEWEKPA